MKYLTYIIIYSKKQYFLNLMEKFFFDDFFLLFIIVMCIFVCVFLIILILEVITLTKE